MSMLSRIGYSKGFGSTKKPIVSAAGGGGGSFVLTGGTPLVPGNGFRYHIFTAPGPLTVTGTGNIDYVVVAGGGPGGRPGGTGGGGGGAGGYRESTAVPITAGSYTITVGGSSADSSISGPALSITAAAGAPGGTFLANAGGSGSGAAADVLTGGAGNTPPVSPPQGNPGGNAFGNGFIGGAAGGGGAGARGTNKNPGPAPSNLIGTSGGVGRAAFSGDTGIPPSYGTPGPTAGRWFAGGGGGGSGRPTNNVGGGGFGGGGPGGPAFFSSIPFCNGVPGTTNTGGGGGGAAFGPAGSGVGGAGGSGIVIVRYVAA